jgi:DeoR/GlpR family transcriptional regulator of sugar metabolism
MITSDNCRHYLLMNTQERREQIVRSLYQRGLTTVHRAVQLTGASPATIRRDFVTLAEQGIAQKVRGGLRLIESSGMTPFITRQVQFSREKELLAQHAAALLKAGDVVIIDGGTTTFHIGACLPPVPLRVITNSLRLASFLDEKSRHHAGLEVFLTGGFLYPHSGLLVGPGAQNSLAQYYADWAFLSGGGITPDGLFNTTELVVETERRMIASADRVVVLADHSKIGKHAMCFVCPLKQIDYLITDQAPASASLLELFGQAGMQVITTAPTA